MTYKPHTVTALSRVVCLPWFAFGVSTNMTLQDPLVEGVTSFLRICKIYTCKSSMSTLHACVFDS